MQIVIEIPEVTYNAIRKRFGKPNLDNNEFFWIETVRKGTPLPKGHWVYELEDWNKWTCSECGWSKRTDVHVKLGYNFCPNCGARMEASE